MKKITLILLVLFSSLFLLTSCEKKEETYIEKPITGIDPIFKESLGYYNEYASCVKTDSKTMYVFYTRNTEAFNAKTDSIAVRKGTLVNGEWSFGEYKTVLERSGEKTAFDHKYIFSPDVIKGKFVYNGETYSYLMAYCGSNTNGRMNAQIGFAVSKTIDGKYVKVGNSPIVTFDQIDYSETGLANYKGVQEPSLVSYDKQGRVQLIYSFYATYNATYMIELDCSDMSNILKGGRMLCNNNGLSDNTINTHLYSADLAYDPVNDEFICVRNFSSTISGLPSVSSDVQVVYADASKAFYKTDNADEQSSEANVWWLANVLYYKVGAVKTSVDGQDLKKSSGYYRVYNASLISDAYGWLSNPEAVDFIFTSSATSDSQYLSGDEYKFSQMLHLFSIPLTRDEEFGED